MHNPRTEYSPVLSDPKGYIYYVWWEKNGRGGEKEKEKEKKKSKSQRIEPELRR